MDIVVHCGASSGAAAAERGFSWSALFMFQAKGLGGSAEAMRTSNSTDEALHGGQSKRRMAEFPSPTLIDRFTLISVTSSRRDGMWQCIGLVRPNDRTGEVCCSRLVLLGFLPTIHKR